MENVTGYTGRLPGLGKGIVVLAICALLVGWLLNTPEGLLGKADAVGYAVCHRIDLRSFHLGDRPLPLCARCSGMFLGALLGLAYQAIFSHRRAGLPSRSVGILFGVFFVAFGLDGVNSYLHLFPGGTGAYEPQNWLRLATGTGMGLVIAGLIFPSFNQTVWQDWDPRPALPGLRFTLPLLVLAVILDAILLTENTLVLYPLALASAAGVLILLTLVYTMVLLLVARQDNRYLTVGELLLPLMGGVGMALLQVVFLDAVRFALTGTWDGFHLG